MLVTLRHPSQLLVAAVVTALLAHSSSAGRCFGDNAETRTQIQVITASDVGCPLNETRESRGSDIPLLAYRGWRSQQLVTEVFASIFEDVLNMRVQFRDLRNYPTHLEYHSDCTWISHQDCLDQFVMTNEGTTVVGCVEDHSYEGVPGGAFCSTEAEVDSETASSVLKPCKERCKAKVHECYDCDFEVTSFAASIHGQEDFDRAMSASGWAQDLGPVGYRVQAGLYFWPESAQNTTIDPAEAIGAAPDNPLPIHPFLDWYTEYSQESKYHSSILNLFAPIEGAREDASADGPCNAVWNNATMQQEVQEGQAWCENGVFVPELCRSYACGEIYHLNPAESMGEVEALIIAHKWPFKVVYLSAYDHSRLKLHGKPFIAYSSNLYPQFLPDTVRIQFPLHAASSVCITEFKSSPWHHKFCDINPVLPSAIGSRHLFEVYPAAAMAMNTYLISTETMQDLVLLDDAITQNHTIEPSINDSAACVYVRNNIDIIRKHLVYCDNGKQPVDFSDLGSCQCLPGTYLVEEEARCVECPRNQYCEGGFSGPQDCVEDSIAEPGAMRLAQCLCKPGYARYQPDSADAESKMFYCIQCDPGFYKSTAANEVCNGRCPRNSWSAPGAVFALDCACYGGYYMDYYRETDVAGDLRQFASCTRCEDLVGGAGAECPGDSVAADTLPINAPVWQGQKGIPHRMPYAKVGWYLISNNDKKVNSSEGYKVEVSACSVVGACLGQNQCVAGHHGLLCQECNSGWAKACAGDRCRQCPLGWNWIHVVIIQIVTLTIFVLLASVMTRHAVMHVTVDSVITKVALQFIILTAPIADLEPAWPPIAYICFPAYAARYSWQSAACILDGLGLNRFYHVCIFAVVIAVAWPMISLLTLNILYRILYARKQEHWVDLQIQVRDLEELIRMCDQSSDLRLADAYYGTRRMANLKQEFQAVLETVIYQSRILKIWRTVYREGERPSFFMDLAIFVNDSYNIVFMHLTVLYSFVIAKLVAGCTWVELGLGFGRRTFTDPDVEYLSGFHVFVAIACGTALLLYGIGYPLLLYVLVHQNRHQLAKEHVGHRFGWIYHGFKVRPPYCYAEVVLLAWRTVPALLMEGFLDRVTRCLMYIIAAVCAVLCHSWYSPYENQGYKILDWLEGISLLLWCCFAAVYESMMGKKIEEQLIQNFHTTESRVMVVSTAVVYVMFWLYVFVLFWRSTRKRIFSESKIRAQLSKVQAVEAKARDGNWDKEVMSQRNSAAFDAKSLLLGHEKSYQEQFLRVAISHRKIADPSRKTISDADIMLKELVLLPGTVAWSPTFSLQDFTDRLTQTNDKESGLDPLSLVQLRDFHCPRFELAAIADVLMEAIESLMTTHGFAYLPFSAMEFVLVDAIHYHYWARKNKRFEQLKCYQFVAAHKCGKEQGLSDLYDGGQDVPRVTTGLRLNELKKAARCEQTPAWHNQTLTVRMLEEYVVYLECEDTGVVREAVQTFAAETQRMRRSTEEAHEQGDDKQTQTYFFAERSTQTDFSKERGVSTGVQQDSAAAGVPGSWAATMRPLHAELVHDKRLQDEMHLQEHAVHEEAAAAAREAEILKEEVFKACGAPITSISKPIPAGQGSQASQASQTNQVGMSTQGTQASEIALQVKD